MDLPFTRDQFFDVLAAYNRSRWPFALGLATRFLADPRSVCPVRRRS